LPNGEPKGICSSPEREESRVPHTFAIFECVGDQRSSDPRLADAERDGKYLYVDRLPLIPKAGMSAAPGRNERGTRRIYFDLSS